MRNIILLLALSFAALSVQAQEKVMNIQKTDGTVAQTRVADLKEISFLASEAGTQGLVVTTLGGQTATVLFETNPVVTISSGKLLVKSAVAETVEFEITDIAEIRFTPSSNGAGISDLQVFACVMQNGGVVLRGISREAVPCVYTLDGRLLPTPPFANGQLLLDRTALGTGMFIVKVGTFTTKIKL